MTLREYRLSLGNTEFFRSECRAHNQRVRETDVTQGPGNTRTPDPIAGEGKTPYHGGASALQHGTPCDDTGHGGPTPSTGRPGSHPVSAGRVLRLPGLPGLSLIYAWFKITARPAKGPAER